MIRDVADIVKTLKELHMRLAHAMRKKSLNILTYHLQKVHKEYDVLIIIEHS